MGDILSKVYEIVNNVAIKNILLEFRKFCYSGDMFRLIFVTFRPSINIKVEKYNSLLMTNLTHFFISLFITPLYVFQESQCSSSGDRIVLIHHLV